MADVIGRIGSENVELNNAATEATLKLLLQATLSANKQTIDQIKGMAKQSGIQVDDANAALVQVGTETRKSAGVFKTLHVTTGLATEQLRQWGAGFAPFIGGLVNGTAKVSQGFDLVAGGAAKLHPALGLLVSAVASVARMQEENLGAYRKISASGVNFAGNLMGMRNTFAQLGMTVAEGTAFYSKNSEAFALMGRTAEEGQQQFKKLALELRNGQYGAQLRALGITGQESAQGLASYIEMTGGRTRKEMQNTDAVVKGGAEYIQQLDRLAQITGKSREQQEQALKKASQNAAWQNMLAGMDEKSKKAAIQGLQEMQNRFGEAGAEMYQAQMMGIPPATEASRALGAMSPEIMNASENIANAAKSGANLAEMQRLGAAATTAGAEASKKFGKEQLAYASFQGGPAAAAQMALLRSQQMASRQETETAEGAAKQADIIAQNNKERQESQAAAMAETEQHLQNLGSTILNFFTPAINALTPIFEKLSGWLDSVATQFAGWAKDNPLKAALVAGGLAVTGFGAALFATRGVAAKLLGLHGRGSAPNNPMYVTEGVGGAGGLGDMFKKKAGTKAGEAAAKGGTKAAAEAAAKTGATAAAKGGLLKGIGKLLPGAGLAFGAYDAYERFKGGDMLGGGIAAASGLASLIPGVGTAVALALDGTNLARDLTKDSKEDKAAKSEDSPAGQAAQAANQALEAQQDTAEILTKEIVKLNTSMTELIRYMRETADYTKRNNDAIKGLGGNLFPTP